MDKCASVVRGALCRGSILWIALALSGCGGGLKYKLDDGTLDTVPAGERGAVFTAQNDVEVARSEQRNAEKQLELFEHDRDIAKKEKEQAELEVEKAVAEQEAAVQSRDENRANAARHNKEVADVGVKVAELKLDWLSQKRDWLKAVKRAAEAHTVAAEAKVELEKAKLAEQKKIKPDGEFAVGNYESQWKKNNQNWEDAKSYASTQESKAKDREKKYQDLVSQQGKMKA
jgi:hypothetical protein